MYMDASDLKWFYAEILKIIAKRSGIPDVDVKSVCELESEINSSLMPLYAEFKEAYDKWYEFHEQIEREGKSGKLSNAEEAVLASLCIARDDTRNKMLKHADSLKN